MKNLIKTSLGMMAGGLLLSVSSHAQKMRSELPNIIFVMADDLGIGDLGCYGQRLIHTPNIDALAQGGMMFTQCYSGSTVSAPSRCSLLTGMHTGHTFIRGNYGVTDDDKREYDLAIPDEAVTVAELLKQKNYRTACVGKWGLGGPHSPGQPNKQGFDYFFGYLGQVNAHFYYPDQLFENSLPVKLDKKVYSPDLIMEKALDFIKENAGSPFFLCLTPTIPHAELIVPPGELYNYDGKFAEKPYVGNHYCSQPKPRATYAAMVSRLDKGVGDIVKLLKEKNIEGNTIVIFTSDNGTHAEGGHDPYFFDSNGPFRGMKRDLYEGGIRTPFIVAWPHVVKPQSVSFHVSAFWDFMPTVCEIAGVKVPKMCDGLSFLPALTGKGRQKEHDFLYFEFHEEGGSQAVIKDRWKLLHLKVNKPGKTRYELYNLNADPGETADVYGQYPEKAEALKKVMTAARTKNKYWQFEFERGL